MEAAAFNKKEIIIMETILFGSGLIIFILAFKYNEMLHYIGFVLIINALGLAAAH
jgi:hypothetical protein